MFLESGFLLSIFPSILSQGDNLPFKVWVNAGPQPEPIAILVILSALAILLLLILGAIFFIYWLKRIVQRERQAAKTKLSNIESSENNV